MKLKLERKLSNKKMKSLKRPAKKLNNKKKEAKEQKEVKVVHKKVVKLSQDNQLKQNE